MSDPKLGFRYISEIKSNETEKWNKANNQEQLSSGSMQRTVFARDDATIEVDSGATNISNSYGPRFNQYWIQRHRHRCCVRSIESGDLEFAATAARGATIETNSHQAKICGIIELSAEVFNSSLTHR
mgnify:CR=1 FL=1